MGLVIKYAGTVRKGFALIFGILISGILQSWMDENKTLTKEDMTGGVLAGLSLWMHATNPYTSASAGASKKVGGAEPSLSNNADAIPTTLHGTKKLVAGKKGGRKSRKED